MTDIAIETAATRPRPSVVIVGRDGMASLGPILLCLAGQTIAGEIEMIAVLPQHAAPPDAMAPWADRFHPVRAVSVPAIGNRGRAAAAGVRPAPAPVLAGFVANAVPVNRNA
jgi:hypothetical protein